LRAAIVVKMTMSPAESSVGSDKPGGSGSGSTSGGSDGGHGSSPGASSSAALTPATVRSFAYDREADSDARAALAAADAAFLAAGGGGGVLVGGFGGGATGAARAVRPASLAAPGGKAPANAKALKVVDPKGPFELERQWRLCGGGDATKRRLAKQLLRPDGKVARALFGAKATSTLDADLLCDLVLKRLDAVPTDTAEANAETSGRRTSSPGHNGGDDGSNVGGEISSSKAGSKATPSKSKGAEELASCAASLAALAAAPRLARSAAFLSASQRASLSDALDARAVALGAAAVALKEVLLR
jgi:hypothetical protein